MSRFVRETDGGTVVHVPAPEVKQVAGKLQLRYKLPTGGKIAICEAPADGAYDKAHYHKGLTEIYILLEGQIRVRAEGVEEDELKVLERPGDICVVPPGSTHMTLQRPGAVFLVVTVGEPVGNPERGNNDWYPAQHLFVRD